MSYQVFIIDGSYSINSSTHKESQADVLLLGFSLGQLPIEYFLEIWPFILPNPDSTPHASISMSASITEMREYSVFFLDFKMNTIWLSSISLIVYPLATTAHKYADFWA